MLMKQSVQLEERLILSSGFPTVTVLALWIQNNAAVIKTLVNLLLASSSRLRNALGHTELSPEPTSTGAGAGIHISRSPRRSSQPPGSVALGWLRRGFPASLAHSVQSLVTLEERSASRSRVGTFRQSRSPELSACALPRRTYAELDTSGLICVE